jgi:hypothetical protein
LQHVFLQQQQQQQQLQQLQQQQTSHPIILKIPTTKKIK